MNAVTVVWASWLAGALAMFAWLMVNEWPTRREVAQSEGLPDHPAFILAAFAIASLAWFAMPYAIYSQRGES